MRIPRWIGAVLLLVFALSTFSGTEARQTPQRVQGIAPAKRPIPPEDVSAATTRFSFIVYGDTRGRRDGIDVQYEHSLVVDGMLAAIKRLDSTEFPVRFVLQTGDAVLDGGDARHWNASFVSLINRLTTDGGVPYFLAPGNHDVSAAGNLESPQRQQALMNYLEVMSQLIPPDGAPRRLSGYPTYAFGYGNTFMLAMDSNIASDEKQYQWVKSQLEQLNRKRYTNIVVMFHHPVFSSGPHGGSTVETPTAVLRSRYMPLFRAHKVKLTLAGHDHLFEHWVERYRDAQGSPQRMDLIVTAGGGAPPYGYRGEPDVTQYVRGNADSRVQLEHLVKPGPDPGNNPYHFVIVRVDGDRLGVEVVGIDWGSTFQPYRSNKSDLVDVAR